uniref:Histone chaperone domain-containing protein n=1 Tax=Mola mola TaxID=94237 RepID=A0A3Q3WTD8_MOLML
MKSFHFLCFRTESKDKEDHKKTDEGSEEEEQIKSGSEEEEQGFNKTRALSAFSRVKVQNECCFENGSHKQILHLPHNLSVLEFVMQGDNKAVVRLKRYIALCGVRHNYKKLLDGCRSVRSQVALLKKELEDLGVHGQPSIKKCKMVRMKREEAQELAHLDVSNIIATQGRSKRRGTLAWREQQKPPSPQYTRTLNSGSDSEDNQAHGGRRKTTDWANLQGIISDDADSN